MMRRRRGADGSACELAISALLPKINELHQCVQLLQATREVDGISHRVNASARIVFPVGLVLTSGDLHL